MAPYVATWFADRLTRADVERLRLREMLLKFLVLLVSVEDDVFEECGPILGLDYFRQILDLGRANNEPARMSADDLKARGIPPAVLHRPNRYLAEHLQDANKIELVNSFLDEWLGAGGVIDSMQLADHEKARMRLSFVQLRNALLDAFIQERELIGAKGLNGLTVADWLAIIDARATPLVEPVLQMLAPFRSGGDKETSEIRQVMQSVVLLSSMADDLKDFNSDWQKQPNLLTSLARGRERARLEDRLATGTFLGPEQLVRDAPRVVRVWHRMYWRGLRGTAGSPYEASVVLFGAVCYVNAVRRLFSFAGGSKHDDVAPGS